MNDPAEYRRRLNAYAYAEARHDPHFGPPRHVDHVHFFGAGSGGPVDLTDHRPHVLDESRDAEAFHRLLHEPAYSSLTGSWEEHAMGVRVWCATCDEPVEVERPLDAILRGIIEVEP